MTDLTPELLPSQDKERTNWLPLILVVAVVAIGVALIFGLDRGNKKSQANGAPAVAPISASLDPYAGNLAMTDLAMSESGNLAGGKLTYLDGRIVNNGLRTVNGVTVQVLFRSFAHEVAQNESLPLKLIRAREPYIDVQSVSAAPIKPGANVEFRLIFDTVSPDWDGAYPELRILHVDVK